ncbi:TlpA disulfide reductase family protein [Caldifermentibacillus hisashii]|uniref:peroxiredoxin family protein n=1 Tax=Caldifermentibacillus hisashii TaxID=996558 RepID=UPI002E21DEE3|nr:TlpA disulfide reductase family protein [Caldifermentibacillus hisashii]
MKKFFIGVLLALVILAGIELFIHKDGKEHVVKKDEQLVNGQSQAQAVYGDAASGLKVGTKAPNFTLQTLSGETISLSELAGKKVILNFWATWCPPCREEMPAMERVYEQYSDSNVEIIAVNSTVGKETKEKAEEFVKELGLTFPIPLDIEGEVIKLYQIYGLPTSYFIDTNGIIHSIYFGPMHEAYMKEELTKMS